MCLFIKKGTCLNVAENDILVYKVLSQRTDSSYVTPYVELPISFADGECHLHSELKPRFNYVVDTDVVDEGLHAFLILESAGILLYVDPLNVIFPAVIPKGSNYFIGEDGDIASDELIIFENKKAYNNYEQVKRMESA